MADRRLVYQPKYEDTTSFKLAICPSSCLKIKDTEGEPKQYVASWENDTDNHEDEHVQSTFFSKKSIDSKSDAAATPTDRIASAPSSSPTIRQVTKSVHSAGHYTRGYDSPLARLAKSFADTRFEIA